MTNTLVFETDTLNMVYCKDGFWLYDETRGMNLAMKQKSEREAFIEALEYGGNVQNLRSKSANFCFPI